MTIKEAIEQAVDRGDPKLASIVTLQLRDRGFTYPQILAKVQEIRPGVTMAVWDGLLYEGETEGA